MCITASSSPIHIAGSKTTRLRKRRHGWPPGAQYPATLIVTADHDDRVVPAHSFKYAATLRATASGERPALILIETKSGHGASNTAKLIEVTADIYAFVLYELSRTSGSP